MNRLHSKVLIGLAVMALLGAAALVSREGGGIVSAISTANIFNFMEQSDHQPGFVVDIKDSDGNIVSKAARGVATGDEIIDSDGNLTIGDLVGDIFDKK